MNATSWRSDIVMLGTFAAWNLGTLQSRAFPYARHLQHMGFRVSIVTTSWDMSHENGCIDCLDGVLIINTSNASAHRPIQAVQQQLNWIDRLSPQIVHVFKPRGFGGLTARCLPINRSFLLDIDDWEGDGGWNESGQYGAASRRMFEWQESSLISRASRITAASTLLVERARKQRHPVPPATTYFLPNGVDSSWVKDHAKPEASGGSTSALARIIIYSRFAEFPADWIDRFCQSLVKLRADPVELLLVGRIPESFKIVAKYEQLAVTRVGYAPREELPALIQSATLAVYPYEDSLVSRSKQSVKLLELMAAGCPVIASDIGDVRRTLGNSGVALKSDRPECFARTVTDLLDQPVLLADMSISGTKRIRKLYTFERLAPRLLDIYRQAGLEDPD